MILITTKCFAFLVYLRCTLDVLRKRIAKRGRPEERNMDPQLLINLQKRYDDWLYYKNTTYPIPSKVLVLDGTMTVEKFTPYVHSQLPKIFPSRRLIKTLENGQYNG